MVKLSTYVLLPLLVFPFLAFSAFQLIFRQSLFQSGLQLRISATCHDGFDLHSYRMKYTSNPCVGEILCGMVVFFHALMNTAYRPLLATLFPALGIVVLILLLEAARDRRPFALGMPTPVGVLFQLLSMGVVIPVYSLLFVITGAASIRPTSSQNLPLKINQANAEALLFGILVGYVLPTILMLFFVRPSLTAIWQGFPFLVALAVLVHRLIRPPSRHVQSGHSTVLATLAFAFSLSALLHAVYVWPVLADTVTLRTLFIPLPIADVLDSTVTSLSDGVVEFIKWDMIFALGAIAIATCWAADSVVSLVGILAWYGVATIAFGPAAAIAGVFLWRERRLNGQSHAHRDPQKAE